MASHEQKDFGGKTSSTIPHAKPCTDGDVGERMAAVRQQNRPRQNRADGR